MREKAVTLADIANELGISKNAVSLALRGKDGVSKSLREQVMAKAKEMDYQGIGKAQGYILALIPQRIASSVSMFYHQLCFDMESYATSCGYQLIITSVSEAEETSLHVPTLLRDVPFMGIVTVGNLSKAYCEMIRKLGMYYVMVDQYYDDVPVDSVTTANSSGAYLLTKHLIEHGHSKIQFFGNSLRTSSLADRWLGYMRAIQEDKLPILDNSLRYASNVSVESYELIEHTLNELTELPTAFVCGHDTIAKDVIRALEKRGLHCPDDFSIVGFDNIQSYDITALDLTTYSTPKAEIARAALDLMLNANRSTPQKIQLYGNVVYRGSVKDIR